MNREDIIGARFGKLIIIGISKKKYHFICKCDCGETKSICKYSLGKYTITCNKCFKGQNLDGKIFGRLTVISRIASKYRINKLLCLCECGTRKVIRRTDILQGKTKSCGCWKKEIMEKIRKTITEQRRKYGTAMGASNSKLYRRWASMKNRCLNKKSTNYHRYGGRKDNPIKICNHWYKSFRNFYDDMGNPPTPNHSIDRINNDGHYSCGHCTECRRNKWPANCRWATHIDQANNRTVSRFVNLKGRTVPLAQLARECKIDRTVLRTRIFELNWDIDKAVKTPSRKVSSPSSPCHKH